MKTTQNRTWSFPLTVEANLGGKKDSKRSAYRLAYFPLTFAYRPAYCPAYLPLTGRAGRSSVTPIRLVLWVEKIIRYKPFCSFSQNQFEVNHNG